MQVVKTEISIMKCFMQTLSETVILVLAVHLALLVFLNLKLVGGENAIIAITPETERVFLKIFCFKALHDGGCCLFVFYGRW